MGVAPGFSLDCSLNEVPNVMPVGWHGCSRALLVFSAPPERLAWNKVPAGVGMGARSGWFQGLIRSGVGLETGKCMQVAGSSQAQKLGSQAAFHTPRGSALLCRMHISATWWLSSCWGPGTMIFTFTCIISFCAFCLMNSFSIPYDNEQRVQMVKKLFSLGVADEQL